jgi:peptidoglycan/LPS O-acetylase OafA/YrhL
MLREASTALPARPRLDHVDGIRALAALVVYLNHAYAQVWETLPKSRPAGLLGWTRYSMIAGHLSVTVFIVVSGFCLMLPVLDHGGQIRGGIKSFFKRRARRILPPYYAALALCLVLIWTVIGKPTDTLWDIPIAFGTSDVVSHLLLLQDIFGTGRINYVFWSIAVEWQIYFLMPLIVWGFRRKGPFVVVTLALAVGYALRFGFDGTRIARMNTHYLGMFALGALAATVVRSNDPLMTKLRERFPWRLLVACGLLAVALLSVHWGIPLAEKRFHLLDFSIGLTAAALLVATSTTTSRLQQVLSFRPLVFIGAFSYSLYLMHAPLLQLLWQYWLHPQGFGRQTMFICLLTFGLALVLGASYLFHLVFEAPFMGASKPATKPRPSLAQAP